MRGISTHLRVPWGLHHFAERSATVTSAGQVIAAIDTPRIAVARGQIEPISRYPTELVACCTWLRDSEAWVRSKISF